MSTNVPMGSGGGRVSMDSAGSGVSAEDEELNDPPDAQDDLITDLMDD